MRNHPTLQRLFVLVVGVCGLFSVCVSTSVARPASLDHSFGDFGTAVYEHGGSLKWAARLDEYAGQPSALALDARGRILVGGGTGSQFLVLRYLSNGQLDPTFGANGAVRIYDDMDSGADFMDPDSYAPRVKDILPRPDGKIVLIGQSYALGSSIHGSPRQVLMVLNEDGSKDEGFGFEGTRIGEVPLSMPRSALLLDNQDFLISGNIIEGSDDIGFPVKYSGFVAKLREDGEPDSSFGRPPSNDWPFPGLLRFIPKGPPPYSAITRILSLKSHKIIAGGHDRNRFFVARFKRDGSLDKSFGKGGRTIANFGGKRCFCVAGGDTAVNSRGSIVQVGYSSFPRRKRIATVALVKYKPNGVVDRRFGHRGFSSAIFGPWVKSTAIAIQKNGRIVVTARKGPSNDTRFMILRYLPSGRLDKSFFGDGKYFTNVGEVSTADKVVVDTKGRVLVAGGRASSEEGSFTLSRFLPGR